jgi:hypothetical protein
MASEVPFTFQCLTVGASLLATSPQKSRASSLPHFPTASFRLERGVLPPVSSIGPIGFIN